MVSTGGQLEIDNEEDYPPILDDSLNGKLMVLPVVFVDDEFDLSLRYIYLTSQETNYGTLWLVARR